MCEKFEVKHIASIKNYMDDLWDLLVSSDTEFVPSLSSRNGTTQKKLVNNTNSELPYLYFNELKNQNFLIVLFHNKLVGFLSYRMNENFYEIKKFSNFLYITTIIIDKKYRKQHLARKLYNLLINLYSNKQIITRTWSTNIAHINLLNNLGFKEIYRKVNDRGVCIDTVYFERG